MIYLLLLLMISCGVKGPPLPAVETDKQVLKKSVEESNENSNKKSGKN